MRCNFLHARHIDAVETLTGLSGQKAIAKAQDSEAHTELAHVNRDVMQPIAAMVANAQAALHFLDRPDVDEVREALSCIVRDGARAAALVDRAGDLAMRTKIMACA
jgi:hypothetical protein